MVERIYTRTGDAGETGLFGGGRVSKASPRVEAYGEVDELTAQLGWALTLVADARVREWIASVQPDLLVVGSHLATPTSGRGRRPWLPELPAGRVEELERWIDEAEDAMPALDVFILPGGSPGGAALHLARTVCRRAERRVAALAAEEPVEPWVLTYLNRLSDLLFDLARLENHRSGTPEPRWEPRKER
ncbi:MAG TPA: cob(I)yrinic acid a,c-diamide adenosyltransferase [Longimicrobiales bacterium]|nr:cob(I)yrinic acid a,c-diamide adenosyltransferase [Longimicrobiales bacterium]